MIPRALLLLAAMIVACAASSFAAAQGFRGVDVQGTQFRVLKNDGGVLTSRDLVGATLTLTIRGERTRLRIDAVEPDPQDKSGEILLHTFSIQQPDGAWLNICSPGPDGRRQGFPLAGRSTPDARFAADHGAIEMVCTAGAQGKCVRFGYKPWKQTADGAPMLDLYNACTRMLRADYCGDGAPTTRDGMMIDVYDDLAIQKTDASGDDDFEAGWTPQGASCVRHVRVKENISLDRLAASCPRLKDRVGASCTEDAARKSGARLFNRSPP